MRDRWREFAFQYRGYRGFNTLDRIAFGAVGLGGVVLVVSWLGDANGTAGLGLVLLVLGLLTLVRDFPGQGG